ncbi:exodeoxyribonuclease III [Cumulibacter manganitolerans]|uniref:exodeoxyribonuclease III n=1 Tax=Cumulibacter manganitolerans TaxID=1884992 RepID=UPI001297BA40|nr:exodeoxyribonuclease III [Cumulibacter manganitolerans]
MPLSVTSANVNGIRAAARRGAIAWLEATAPSVITLQEVRGSDAHLAETVAGTAFESWHRAHAPSHLAGRAGVAILSSVAPLEVRTGLGDFLDDGRWIEIDLPSDEHGVLTVVSAYVHTGEAGSERQVVKLRFLDAMHNRFEELAKRSAADEGEALVTGDLNVAHRELDIKNWKGNLKKSGFLPEERAYFDRWFGHGFDVAADVPSAIRHDGDWIDLGRRHGGDGPGPYTWWSWRGKAFDNDAGWRIDYQMATPRLAARCVAAEVGRAATYAERWSDHAPLTATFH